MYKNSHVGFLVLCCALVAGHSGYAATTATADQSNIPSFVPTAMEITVPPALLLSRAPLGSSWRAKRKAKLSDATRKTTNRERATNAVVIGTTGSMLACACIPMALMSTPFAILWGVNLLIGYAVLV